jgi:hypothetical protein
MKRIYGLIAGIALVGVTPFALADADPSAFLQKTGDDVVTLITHPDKSGINADSSSNSFWYAGTSGVSSN